MKIALFVKGIALAGFCTVAPSLFAAEDQGSAQTDPNQPSSEAGQGMQQGMQQGMHMMHQISAQVPTDSNRASKLIGMDVVNQQNQKLGTVRDLVVDPKSQRVAYAWVEKSDETGNTGKYVAIPINVFTPSTDQKNLTLNADKARFSSAHGYAQNQMPNMALPPSQISFWHSISEAAGAQPGQSEQQQPMQSTQPKSQP